MKKRLISLLLSVAVLTTSVPVSTFADPSAGQEPAVSSEFTLKAKSGGFYENDQLSVAVHSENDWKLKSDNHEVSYELRDKDTNKIVENDAVIASLSADTKQTNRTFAAELT